MRYLAKGQEYRGLPILPRSRKTCPSRPPPSQDSPWDEGGKHPKRDAIHPHFRGLKKQHLPVRSAPGRRSRARQAPRGLLPPALGPGSGPARSPRTAVRHTAAESHPPWPPGPTQRPCLLLQTPAPLAPDARGDYSTRGKNSLSKGGAGRGRASRSGGAFPPGRTGRVFPSRHAFWPATAAGRFPKRTRLTTGQTCSQTKHKGLNRATLFDVIYF